MREQAGRMERGEAKQGSGALHPLAGDGSTVSTGARSVAGAQEQRTVRSSAPDAWLSMCQICGSAFQLFRSIPGIVGDFQSHCRHS